MSAPSRVTVTDEKSLRVTPEGGEVEKAGNPPLINKSANLVRSVQTVRHQLITRLDSLEEESAKERGRRITKERGT